MPDTEVPRRRGWTSGWLLTRQSGLMHLAGRTTQDIGDHEPRPLRHRRRGIAPFQAVVIVQIVVSRIQSVGETFHRHAVPIDDVLQPMRLQAGHPAEIQTVIGHGDATESGHVVVLLMMDRHHGRRRWFLRATGTCRCLCRHPRTRPVPGRQNLADGDDVAYPRKRSCPLTLFQLHFTVTSVDPISESLLFPSCAYD